MPKVEQTALNKVDEGNTTCFLMLYIPEHHECFKNLEMTVAYANMTQYNQGSKSRIFLYLSQHSNYLIWHLKLAVTINSIFWCQIE